MTELVDSMAVVDRTFGWRELRLAAAVGDLVLLITLIVTLQDTLALALTIIILVGLALTRLRGGWPGNVVLALVFTDIAAYTLTGALNNIRYGEELGDIFLPAALAVLSLTGIVAAVASLVRRDDPAAGDQAAPVVAVAAVLAFSGMLAAGLLAEPAEAAADVPAGGLALVTEGMTYDQGDLTAQAGEITLSLENNDLFWHTFTVDELGVNVSVPVGAERRITFDAPPGVYEFYCAIPGHIVIGMKGTLTVIES